VVCTLVDEKGQPLEKKLKIKNNPLLIALVVKPSTFPVSALVWMGNEQLLPTHDGEVCVSVCCNVCSVLQCVAVCCNVLHCVAFYCSVLQYVAVCCSVCCRVLQCDLGNASRIYPRG